MTRAGRRQLTPYVRSQIRNWVADGVPRRDIAKRLNTSLGSLAVRCSRLGISLTNKEPRVTRNYPLRLPEEIIKGFHEHARDLGWSDEKLLTLLVEIVQNDNLYEAIL